MRPGKLSQLSFKLSYKLFIQVLVSGSNDKSVRVWSSSETGHTNPLTMASSSESRTENLYQVQLSRSQRRLLGTLTGHSNDVTSLDARNSMIASGCADRLVRVWRWRESGGLYEELSVSPLSGKLSCKLPQLSCKLSQLSFSVSLFSGHGYSVYCVRLDPGGERLVSVGLDGCVILWSLDSGDIVQRWTHSESLAFRVVTFSQDGAEIAAGNDDNNIYR